MKLKIDFSFGIEYRADGSALLDHERRAGMKEISRRAVDLFGGYTQVNTVGAQHSVNMTEAGCLLSVLVDSEESNVKERAVKLAERIQDSLQQKEICVTVTQVEFLTLK